eukprot:TRINITY_DN89_c0_g1_i1.p1 TRINITY_DN89_c0_g1~~TRINITY_DN89_c0_g1_i1.p1  ORF type:complete len:389 (-),score=-34.29 TRINITY_DN89_c0_g1_i1:1016-2182(-)
MGTSNIEPVAQPKKKSAALDFWVHLVHGCNLRCFYCYIPHLEKGMAASKLQQNSFSLDKIEPLLKQLFKHCSETGIRQLGLKFAGGEPTLNLELLEHFCAEAERLKGDTEVKFSIISNGTFEDPETIRIFYKYKFGVSFSVDGAETSHDKVRFHLDTPGQKEGTWKQVWRNVDKCLDNGIRPYLLYTVTASNIKDLPEFRDAAVSKFVGYRLGLVRLPTPPKRSIVEKVSEQLISFYKHAGESQPTSLPIERFVRFSEWKLDSKKSFACSSGRNYFSIDQRGNVSTCQMRQDKTYGNVAEEDFSTIHDRISKCDEHAVLANPDIRDGPCTRCEYIYVCSGGCPQHTKMGFGVFDHTSPWCHVYGNLLPHYVEAVAKQMLRRFYEVQTA